ncbi:pseudouridine synthase [Paracoccus chinensis]|uniref:Pseudouridine synthase n=1 Tax=Paracoccus chinensis TaxID=525640 RepID=A0A1G9E026_9RHOB|nr:pseudouridine synthase [Paracoccus chinensis]SDK69453.1 23S rRNA pseudouridine2605 synthase [Paracoccus chinensis]
MTDADTPRNEDDEALPPVEGVEQEDDDEIELAAEDKADERHDDDDDDDDDVPETPAEPAKAGAAKKSAPAQSSGGERIAKIMARAGVASRREAERMIVEGRVTVNGKKISSPALDVLPADKVTVDGKPMEAAQETRLWLYYKPVGLVTSESDEKGRQTVFDALPRELPRVMSVGRLDLNSEGLLLLTNDGELKRRLELPSTGWLRRYRVRVNGQPNDLTFDPLRRGATIEGEEFAPMEIKLDSQQGANAWLTVGIREGKNREIRRAMAHVGLIVNRLIRIGYGPFKLTGMEENEVREVKRRVLRDQLGGLLTGETDEAPRAASRGRPDAPRGPRREGDMGERKPRAPRRDAEAGDRKPWSSRPEGAERKPRTPRRDSEGGERRSWSPRPEGDNAERKPRAPRRDGEGADRKPWAARSGEARPPRGEGFERKPRREGGDFDRKPREGGYERGPKTGGFDRKPAGPGRAEGGRFGDRERGLRPAEGGFERKGPGRRTEGENRPRGPRADGAGQRPDRARSEGGPRGERKPWAQREQRDGDRPARPPREGAPRGPRRGEDEGFARKPRSLRPDRPQGEGGRPDRADRGPRPGGPAQGGRPRQGGAGPGKPRGGAPTGRGPGSKPDGRPRGPRGPDRG